MPLTTLGMTEKWRPMAIALLQDICFEIGTPWQEFTTHATLLAIWDFFVFSWRHGELLSSLTREIWGRSPWICEPGLTARRQVVGRYWKVVQLEKEDASLFLFNLYNLCMCVASECAPSSKFQPWHQPNFGLYHVVSQEWNISWHCTTWTQ